MLWKGAGRPGPSLTVYPGLNASADPEAGATRCRRFSASTGALASRFATLPYNRHRQR